MNPSLPDIPPGTCAQLACILEVTARKAGNVHREADFAGTTYLDFLLSAAALGPVLERAPGNPVGQTILECVRATRRLVGSNTNLGMILLLAPLAAAPSPARVDAVLAHLTLEDARQAYEAIRLAHPGGMGKVSEQDVAQEPTQPLRAVMALAAPRDLIARQYVTDFQAVLHHGAPFLREAWRKWGWEKAIQATHLELMACFPDSLIARKRGLEEAAEASRAARLVLDAGFPDREEGRMAFLHLDAWLRQEGNTRNPGTSADLVTACLFVGLRENWLQPPFSP